MNNALNLPALMQHTLKISWIFYINFFAIALLLLDAVLVHFHLRGMAADLETNALWSFNAFSELKIEASLLPTIVNIVLALVNIFAYISALTWFYRLVEYAKKRGLTGYHPVLAVFSFFIPIFNIVLPLLIMNSVWQSMRKLTAAPYPATIFIAWVIYLVSMFGNLPMLMLMFQDIASMPMPMPNKEGIQVAVSTFISADFYLILSQIAHIFFILMVVLIAQRIYKMLGIMMMENLANSNDLESKVL